MDIPKVEEINRWLPFLIRPLDLEDFFANKGLYPLSLPVTKKGFYLEAAFLRYQLKGSNTEGAEGAEKNLPAGRQELILTSKFLSAVPNSGLALLLATDVYQPHSILKIYAEGEKSQEQLGAVVSLTEVNKKRKILGKLVFTFGKQQKVLEIRPESMILISVDKDTELKLGFRLRGAKVLGKTRAVVSVSGGKVGIVIDSRGRPIEIEEGEVGWEKIERWTRVFI